LWRENLGYGRIVKMTYGLIKYIVGVLRIPHFTLRITICVLMVSVMLSGCVTLSSLTGEVDREREERQRLEDVCRDVESQNAQFKSEIHHLKLGLAKSAEKESALLAEIQRLRGQKAELEAKLWSCRQHQKKFEGQLAENDVRLAELIESRKEKWAEQEEIKSEFSSGLKRFAGCSVERRGEAVAVVLQNALTLTSGKVKIRESSLPLLRELAALLKKHPECEFVIEGHTEDIPTKRTYPSNWELSTARALAILRCLEREGIAPEKMSAVGYGEYLPRADNSTPEGRRANRRVEVLVLKEKG
jgi:chemotaxis protein MotB